MTTTKRKITTLVLSIIMAVAFIIGFVPTFSVAATAEDTSSDTVTIDLSTVTQDVLLGENHTYSLDGGTTYTTYVGEITFTGTTGYSIILNDKTAGTHDIVLDNVSMTNKNINGNIYVGYGNTLNLTVKGTNTLKQTGGTLTNSAPSIQLNAYATLTITEKSTGVLNATGGNMYRSIGGKGNFTININGGTINALASSSGSGRGGIGADENSIATECEININNAIVTAESSYYGNAAIGGGRLSGDDNTFNINIKNSTVVAKQTKGNAAAIGGGNNDKSVYNIKIENSNVTAIATDGSGIGLGYSGGTLGNIEIINSVVTATNSDSYNAGIGGGQSTNIGNILIQNSTVTATGGKYAAGIGGGWKNTVAENDKVTIIGSNVLATAGSNAQAIGKGSDGAAVSIQDGSGNALTLTKITLQNVTNDVTVTKISTTTGYEDVDIQTINGVLYLYLPSGESPTSVIANGNEYVGTVSSNVGTFVYEHTCAIGESGTPATCTTLAICGSCGQTFGELAPHTTSYLLNGNVLMESCSECTHSATATLSADEVYTYTGEEIKEATIEYSEKWQGEKPTEITYNDNVESGIATAKITVEGHELTTTFRIAKPYDITINTPENGSVTVEETTVLEGGNVVLTISPDIGYVLDVLTVTCGETDVVVTDNSFVMPSGNVSISATFKQCTSHSFENGVCTACKYECEHTQWKDGICSACGIFEQPTLTDGVYEINNVGNLFWFAEQVNSGSTAINGKLMKDIDLSGYNWVPIGTYSDTASTTDYPYKGTFDGNYKVIKNLSVKVETAHETGLFGRISGGKVINLGIVNATVENTQGVRAGVIAGEIHNSTVTNVYTAGVITVTTSNTNGQAGGIAGECANSTLTNCYTTFGYLTSNAKTVTNCYYMADTENTASKGTNLPASAFASGELAYLLNSGVTDGTQTWYQTCGEGSPAFEGDTVYYGYISCADDATAVYTDNSAATAEKPEHIDENTDHVCDNECGKTDIGTHADSATDTDHVCDYGCGATIEDCSDKDNDKDHNCDICGAENVTEHTPNADDGNCMTEITCSECGTVTTAAKENHTPNADDGDCTTAITCKDCGTVTTEAKENHTPNEDDGDCTTAITCKDCGTITTEAKTSHTPNADDGDCTTEITCSECGTVTTAAKENHTPNADDGDCTTAITCKDCGTVTTAAKTSHTPNADDGDCTTAITCKDCGTVTTEAKNTHIGGTATCLKQAECETCGTPYGAFAEHKDEIKDHICDYGCGKTDIGEHSDSNKDHTCDYGCAEPIGEHADSATDKDHVCDYGCNATLENCSDVENDKDHNCDICGAENVSEHSYGNATCENPATCSECGGTTGTALGHNTEGSIAHKDATCTETGVVGGTYCTRCNEGKAAAEATIGVLGHNTEGSIAHKDATCTETGVVGGTYCTRCNNGKTAAEATIGVLGHSYGTPNYSWNDDYTKCTATRVCTNDETHVDSEDGTVRSNTTNATCTADGKTVYTATFNNSAFATQTKEVTITSDGHSFDETKWGYREADGHAYTCTVCGDEKEVIGHTSSGAVTEDTAETCTVCGYVITPELGHTHSASAEWEYNDTHHWHDCVANDGQEYDKAEHSFGAWTKVDDSTHKRTCACGKVETVNHNWGEGEVTTQPTHTANGERTYTCECGATKTESVDKLTAHAYGEWEKVDDSTHKRTCICGDIQTEEHGWDGGEVTTQPTHTANGEKTYTCECGATKTEAVDKLTAHAYGEWEKVDDSTHKRTCACGSEEIDNHSYGEWTVTKEATATEKGEKTKSCVCGHTVTEEIPATGTSSGNENEGNSDNSGDEDLVPEPTVDNDGLSGGAIAAIVIGVVVLGGGFVIFFIFKKKRF